MDGILPVMTNSFVAMMKIFCISAVGVAMAKYPKVEPLMTLPAIKYISRIAQLVFIPALIISALGSSVSISLLSRLGMLIPFCFTVNTVSYIWGYALRFLHEDDPVLFQASMTAIANPNAIAFPLLVVQSLCETHPVVDDYADAGECFREGTAMMFIYSIGWHLMYWSYGYRQLVNISQAENGTATTSANPSSITDIARHVKSIFSSPAMLAIYCGMFIGLIPGLKGLMFERISVLRPIGGAIEVLAQPCVAMNSLIMAASLAHVDISQLYKKISNRASSGDIEMATNINDNATSIEDPEHASDQEKSIEKRIRSASMCSDVSNCDLGKLEPLPAAVPEFRTILMHILGRYCTASL